MVAREGYQQTDIGIFPREWVVRSLNDLGLDISDGNYSSKYPKASDFCLTGVPFIRANNIHAMTVVDQELRFISESLHAELLKGHLKAHDILITTRGDIGQIAFVPTRHVGSNINAQLVRLNSLGRGVDPRFLGYLLAADISQQQFSYLETGSALKQLPVGRLVLLKGAFPPSLKEQQAIATALSDADAYIESLEQLITKKRQIKQGVMQELLTGERRLPGFEGKWEVRKLEEVADADWGNTTMTKASYTETGATAYSAAGPDGFVSKGEQHRPGVVLSAIGAQCGKTWLAVGQWTPIKNTIWFRGKDAVADTGYLYWATARPECWRKRGQAQPFIALGDVRSTLVRFPIIEEQVAIAKILSDVDADIAANEGKLAKAHYLKQAMMQQLLTGKIRLV